MLENITAQYCAHTTSMSCNTVLKARSKVPSHPLTVTHVQSCLRVWPTLARRREGTRADWCMKLMMALSDVPAWCKLGTHHTIKSM